MCLRLLVPAELARFRCQLFCGSALRPLTDWGNPEACTLRREYADMSLPASADSFYAAQCCGAIIVMMPCVQRAMTQPVLALLTVARVPGVAMIYVYTREKDAGAGYSVCRQPFPLLDCASVSASSFFLSLFPRHGGAHRLTKFRFFRASSETITRSPRQPTLRARAQLPRLAWASQVLPADHMHVPVPNEATKHRRCINKQ